MTIYYLMVKTHKKTGLQYLCQSSRKHLSRYKGSGKYWKLHLKKHGNDIETRYILKCYTKTALREWGLYYSNLWSVVKSNKWANLKPEEGDGSSSETLKEIMNRPDVRAKTLAAQNTPEYKAKQMGDNNSSKRPEVRAKIANSIRGTKASLETKDAMSKSQKIAQNRPEVKKNQIKRSTGHNNPRYNHTIYSFKHYDGRIEICTQFDLRTKYPSLQRGPISLMCRGLRDSYNGWELN